MAQIQTQNLVIKLSKLAKSGDKAAALLPDGVASAIEAVVAELIDDPMVIVECEVDE
jgi:hypothetical protein